MPTHSSPHISPLPAPKVTTLRTDDFDFTLPEQLIASRPPDRRDASRMLVVDRAAGTVTPRLFTDFESFLNDGDLVVLNDTKVVPSRFFSDDGKVELVRLEEPEPGLWRCLVRPGKRMRPGRDVSVAGVRGEVESVLDKGERMVRFEREIDVAAHGQLALPHYMEREPEEADSARYQTVFACQPGAIAAPTAGLHFTPQLLAGLRHTFLTLHVGVGTFRPVKAERIADHDMHSERYELANESAQLINATTPPGRVVSVGTTVTRVLEHLAREGGGTVVPGAGETDIFLYPGCDFLRTGALLTNFHLPKSTLFMLVCGFAGSGLMREAYEQAIAERFRFYSYGDCMLIV